MRFFNNVDKHRKAILFYAVGIAAVLLVLLMYGLWIRRPAADIAYNKRLSTSTVAESHLLVTGKVFWGRDINRLAQERKLKAAYPFSKLHEFQPEIYDGWAASLECPTVLGLQLTSEVERRTSKFNCPVQYLPEAARRFDVLSLATNHVFDQGGRAGLETTREQLDKYDIQYFGDYNPRRTRDVCEVISLPARIRQQDKQQDTRIPIAMCGFQGLYRAISDAGINEIARYKSYMPVIVMVHDGEEYQSVVTRERKRLYRNIIDNGADAVFGTNPQWVQPSEAYRGKLIAYSLGSFLYDQQYNQEVSRSAAFSMAIRIQNGQGQEEAVKQWTDIAKTCRAYRDDCLEKYQSIIVERPPLKFAYQVVGSVTDSGVTKRANHKQTQEILSRLNWNETRRRLE